MKLMWTEPAVLDLESVREYIDKDSEYYAALIVENILSAVEKLKVFPHLGRKVPEYTVDNVREILVHQRILC